jgi:hypothetical protein
MRRHASVNFVIITACFSLLNIAASETLAQESISNREPSAETSATPLGIGKIIIGTATDFGVIVGSGVFLAIDKREFLIPEQLASAKGLMAPKETSGKGTITLSDKTYFLRSIACNKMALVLDTSNGDSSVGTVKDFIIGNTGTENSNLVETFLSPYGKELIDSYSNLPSGCPSYASSIDKMSITGNRNSAFGILIKNQSLKDNDDQGAATIVNSEQSTTTQSQTAVVISASTTTSSDTTMQPTEEWYVFINGSEQGPYSTPEMKMQINSGRIRPSMSVTKIKGSQNPGDWQSAGEAFSQFFNASEIENQKHNDRYSPNDSGYANAAKLDSELAGSSEPPLRLRIRRGAGTAMVAMGSVWLVFGVLYTAVGPTCINSDGGSACGIIIGFGVLHDALALWAIPWGIVGRSRYRKWVRDHSIHSRIQFNPSLGSPISFSF